MTRTQTGDIKTGFVDGMSFGYGWAVVKEPKGVTAMLSPGDLRPRRGVRHAGLDRPEARPVRDPADPADRPAERRRVGDAADAAGAGGRGGEEVTRLNLRRILDQFATGPSGHHARAQVGGLRLGYDLETELKVREYCRLE